MRRGSLPAMSNWHEISATMDQEQEAGSAGGSMKFRHKPVIVEAVQFDGTPAGAILVFETFDIPGGKFRPDYDLRTGTLLIPTLEGGQSASRNDWIIKGTHGEFYPCKPSIFADIYEEQP